MIKIYTHHDVLVKEYQNYFFPLLEELYFVKDSKSNEKYVFTQEIEDSDILILPLDINFLIQNGNTEIVNLFQIKAKEYHKKLWVYSSGDTGISVKENYIFVFKMADFSSFQNKQSVIMPVFINDPIKTFYNDCQTWVSKTPKPIIGYVGHAKGGFIKGCITILIYLKENYLIATRKIYSDYYRLYFSSHIRLKYLKLIQKCKSIESHFIFRNKYRAGVKTKEDRIKTTLDFFENIKNTQYTFCMRGGGNFSVRLYETLAMGRIPIFINTDSILPLSSIIEWNKHSVMIDDFEIKILCSKIINFHHAFNNEEFLELQKSNRLLWEHYLTRANYFNHIHDLYLEQKL